MSAPGRCAKAVAMTNSNDGLAGARAPYTPMSLSWLRTSLTSSARMTQRDHGQHGTGRARRSAASLTSEPRKPRRVRTGDGSPIGPGCMKRMANLSRWSLSPPDRCDCHRVNKSMRRVGRPTAPRFLNSCTLSTFSPPGRDGDPRLARTGMAVGRWFGRVAVADACAPATGCWRRAGR